MLLVRAKGESVSAKSMAVTTCCAGVRNRGVGTTGDGVWNAGVKDCRRICWATPAIGVFSLSLPARRCFIKA